MSKLLADHQATALALRRAAAAGLDLVALKGSDPVRYMILNAEEFVRVGTDLAAAVGEAFFDLHPDHELFQIPDSSRNQMRLLAFPGLDRVSLGRVDDHLSALVSRLEGTMGLLVFRVVADMHGEWREFDRPLPPGLWSGQAAMVGPFADEEEARHWAEQELARSDRAHDLIPYAGVWLCDVFDLDDPDGEPFASS